MPMGKRVAFGLDIKEAGLWAPDEPCQNKALDYWGPGEGAVPVESALPASEWSSETGSTTRVGLPFLRVSNQTRHH